MEQEFIDEAANYPTLGPNYFVAHKIAAKITEKFEADHFKPLIEQFSEKFRDALWQMVEWHLLNDTEANLQGLFGGKSTTPSRPC